MDVSNNPLTLQNPLGRIGKPSSRIRNDPQAPGPVNTGDLIAVRCSCPEPLLIQTPGILLKVCFGCWASILSRSLPSIETTLRLLDHPLRLSIFFIVMVTSSISEAKNAGPMNAKTNKTFFSLRMNTMGLLILKSF